MDSANCFKCGNKEFQIEENSKICLECGYKSKHFQIFKKGDGREDEIILDEDPYDSNVEGHKKSVIEPNIDDDITFSTYEAYNIILRKWTSALQHLGASKKLKDTVSSLWFLYLQLRKVAFVKDIKCKKDLIEKTPELFHLIEQRDAKFIKGMNIPGKEKKKGKKKKSSKTKEDKLINKIAGKKVKTGIADITIAHEMSQVLNDLKLSQCANSDDDSDDESNFSQNNLFEFCPSEDEDEIISEDEALPPKITAILYHNPYYLTLDKLLALLYLAVLLLKDNSILLLDIVRWCKEGVIPYYSASYLLENDMKIDKEDSWVLKVRPISYKLLADNVGWLSIFLSIQYLPLPPYGLILGKFIAALKLPDSCKNSVLSLLHNFCDQFHGEISAPEVEIHVAGAILLTFKIMFGMDDYQENVISRIADKLNEMMEKTNSQYRLFSWSKWQIYVNSLIWFNNEVNPAFTVNSEGQPIDAKKIQNQFWTEAIWNYPKVSENEKLLKNKWNLVSDVLELKQNKLEDVLNGKKIIDWYEVPLTGVVESYINSGYEKDPSQEKRKLLKIARKLKKANFPTNIFDWQNNLQAVSEVFEKEKIYIVFRRISLYSNCVSSTEENFPQNAQVKTITIPKASDRLWHIQDWKDTSGIPKSYAWLMRILADICGCTIQDLLHYSYKLEVRYNIQSQSKIKKRRSKSN